ncbi:MAG: AAA family ATPase [Phycisphaeraceae bacterium]|nr:AAA family ATPase [Phycisphaeraceae bacterium]
MIPIDKPLPSAYESEVALIGAILCDSAIKGDMALRCRDALGLNPADIHDERCRLVYMAALHVADNGKPTAVAHVHRRLEDTGRLADAGGHDFLMDAVDCAANPATVESHVRTIREKAALRGQIDAMEMAVGDAYSGKTPVEVAERVQRVTSLAARVAPVDDTGPMLIRMSDVEPREVRWLWPGRIPLGRLTLLVGRPGEGKSFVTMDLAARITNGSSWPDGGVCDAGDVILITGEDDPADTIRPRLDAHGANVNRVHLLRGTKARDERGRLRELAFTLADVDTLEKALGATASTRLVIVDPIGSFIGGRVDGHRDNEVRSILAPVAALAEKHGPAILLVLHTRKAAASRADDMALGSRAYTGIARATWHLSRDPENKARRLLLPGKNNLAPEGGGLAFSIVGDPPRIEWEPDPVQMHADDALAAENDSDDRSATDEAKDWLAATLGNGTMLATEVKRLARQEGYTDKVLRRAKESLHVVAQKDGFGGEGRWYWSMPTSP